MWTSASRGTGTPVDIGGICSYSQGTVVNCTQYGVVGYPSIGYNVGGILGRNRGYVATCRNEGHIQGRKDVGGIVGQMEPDYLATLSTQFQQLGNQVDSLEIHGIRVLPPEEKEIYVLRNGMWNLVETERMGSYLAFSAQGAEVEFAIVRTQTNYPALAAIVIGALILAALVVLALRRGTKNPGRRPLLVVLAVALLICAVLGVVYTLPQTQKAAHALGAYEVLKPWVEQPQWSAQLQVQARLGEKESGFTAQVTRSQVEDIPVTAISENGRELYYAQGVLFLPDGAAYRIGDGAPDYSGILDQLAQMYALVDVEAVDGVYTLSAQEPQATKLLELLLPQTKSLLGGGKSLTVDLVTANGALTEINFTGAGNLSDSVKTPFSLSARIHSIMGEGTDVPQPVRQALLTGEYDAQQVYSRDLVRLATAWKTLEDTPALGATVKLAADCGLITLAEDFRLYRWNGENRPVCAMELGDLLLYMTDSAVCDAKGRAVDLPTRETVDIQAISDVVYENFSKATFRCEGTEEGYRYTVTLTAEGMKALMAAVFPQMAALDCTYETGTATLTITDDGLTGLEISCGGSVKVAMVPMGVSLDLEVKLLRQAIPDLPDAVKTALDN